MERAAFRDNMEKEKESNMEDVKELDIVVLTIKKENPESYEEEEIQTNNEDTKYDVVDPKPEIEPLQFLKEEISEECNEKITIEYGFINKHENLEENPSTNPESPRTSMVDQFIRAHLVRNSVKCKFCSKRFARNAAMLEHLQRHKWSTKSPSRRDLGVEDETGGMWYC